MVFKRLKGWLNDHGPDYFLLISFYLKGLSEGLAIYGMPMNVQFSFVVLFWPSLSCLFCHFSFLFLLCYGETIFLAGV